MKHLLLLLFTCISLALSAQNSEQILRAMADYDYEAALSLIENGQPDPSLLIQKAKALKGLNRLPEAQKTLKQILEQDPKNLQALIELAECCKQSGRFKDALLYYKQAVDLKPDNKFAHMQYAKILFSQGKYRLSLDECTELLKTDSSADVLRLRAENLEKMNNILEALLSYTNILNKYPEDYLTNARMGSILMGMKEYSSVIALTERYRQIDSTNIDINRQNAQAYCLNLEYPTAIRRYNYLTEEGDSTYHTCYYLGVSYYATGKYKDAYKWLVKAYEQVPDNADLLYYLGRSSAKLTMPDQGIAYLNQALDLTIPKDSVMARMYKALVECYHVANKTPQEIQALKMQYRYDPDKPVLLYSIAHISFQKGDMKATERYLKAFLKTKDHVNESILRKYSKHYAYADRMLKALYKEKFFKDGIDSAYIAPATQ